MTEENGKMMVRGKAIASIPKFVLKYFGKDGYQKWLEAISAESHAVFGLPIKQDDWYPIKEALIQPCANIAQLFYNWDLKKSAWEMGRYSADYGLKNVYKLFVKMGSANFFLNKASEFMNSYYQPATIELGDVSENSATMRITHFPGIDKTIEYRIAGWIQRALEINGHKSVNVDIPKSMAEFKPLTEFHATWD